MVLFKTMQPENVNALAVSQRTMLIQTAHLLHTIQQERSRAEQSRTSYTVGGHQVDGQAFVNDMFPFTSSGS
jgi:hypothetical protein